MKTFELIAVVAGSGLDVSHADLQLVEATDYTAVLTHAPRKLLALPMSRKEAMRAAASRQAMLEDLLKCGTVLVAKPDQWLSVAQARLMLAANAAALDDLSRSLSNRVQVQITVSWDAEKVLQRFRSAPELAPLFTAGSVNPQMLEGALSKLQQRLIAQMRIELDQVIADLITLPVSEDILCNFVVLIDPTDEPLLDQAVERIDAIWPEGLRIRQIGPSAAGSFALLELRWISDEEIYAAQDLLGVAPNATQAELRSARRSALMQRACDAEQIRNAADILQAARQSSFDGFHHLSVLSEEQGISDTKLNAVA